MKKYIHTKTRTQLLAAALFTTAENWKQPKCPSTDTGCGINQALQRQSDDGWTGVTTWTNLENIILDEKSITKGNIL